MSLIPMSFQPQLEELMSQFPNIIGFQYFDDKAERIMKIMLDNQVKEDEVVALPNYLPAPIDAKVVVVPFY